jgi:uncharacterized FlaG/YvyC family protein
MIDPVQALTVAAPLASTADPSGPSPTTTDVGAIAGAQKAAAAYNSSASTQAAQAAQTNASNGASDSQSDLDGPPLRLLIEHDKTTNHYVYKLYDSSGRIVREIPQESLADAQKQATGATGSLFDTKV